MSNTQEQDRVLGRLSARQLSTEELDAVAGRLRRRHGPLQRWTSPEFGSHFRW